MTYVGGAITPAVQRQITLTDPLRIVDGITHRELAKILKEAAVQAQKLIEQNLARETFSGAVSAARLQRAVAGISRLSTTMWNGIGKITNAGMYQEAQLAADQALDLDFMLGMPGIAVAQYAEAMHFEARQVVDDLISRRTTGFALKESIYAEGRKTVLQVGKIVERHLVLQSSARDIAKSVRDFYAPDVPGGASYAAMRLGRTEINNAHHETTKRLAQERPWVEGMKWNLSGSHPHPDECNEFADHEEGLGTGVFNKYSVPSKPHPQCLCYLTHELPSSKEFIDNLVSGQYDAWLGNVRVP